MCDLVGDGETLPDARVVAVDSDAVAAETAMSNIKCRAWLGVPMREKRSEENLNERLATLHI